MPEPSRNLGLRPISIRVRISASARSAKVASRQPRLQLSRLRPEGLHLFLDLQNGPPPQALTEPKVSGQSHHALLAPPAARRPFSDVAREWVRLGCDSCTADTPLSRFPCR